MKNAWYLIIVVIVCGLALRRAAARRWNQGGEKRGKLVAASVDAAAVRCVAIEAGERRVTLTSDASGVWRVRECGDSPARVSLIQMFVSDLLRATVARRLTGNDPTGFGLTPETGAVTVRLLDGDGGELARVVLGRVIARQNPGTEESVPDKVAVGRHVLVDGEPATTANPFPQADYPAEKWKE